MEIVLFYVADGLLGVGGLVSIGLGLYILLEYGRAIQWMSFGNSYPSKEFIAIGIFMVAISTVGVVSVVRMNQKMIYTLICLLLSLTLIEMGVGGAAVDRKLYLNERKVELHRRMMERFEDDNNFKMVTRMEGKNKCCAVNGYSDYLIPREIPGDLDLKGNVSETCVKKESPPRTYNPPCIERAFQLHDFFWRSGMAIGLPMVAVGVSETTVLYYITSTFSPKEVPKCNEGETNADAQEEKADAQEEKAEESDGEKREEIAEEE